MMSRFKKNTIILCTMTLLIVLCVIAVISYARRDAKTAKKSKIELVDVDFTTSLGVLQLGERYFTKHEIDQERYTLSEKLWSANRPKLTLPNDEWCIPPVIHQIWLSKEAFPEVYKKCQMTWIKNHPGWQYHLWTEKDISKLPEPIKSQISLARDIQEKEYLLKAAILVQLGGVVIDIGFESIKPLDPILKRYACFIALEPPLKKSKIGAVLHVSPYIIGCHAGHPLMKAWQNQMLKKYLNKEGEKVQAKNKQCPASMLDTVCFSDYVFSNEGGKAVIFPPTYFFPLNQESANIQGKVKDKKTKSKKKNQTEVFFFSEKRPVFSAIQSESYAVHMTGGYWSGVHNGVKDKEKKKVKESNVLIKQRSEKNVLQEKKPLK